MTARHYNYFRDYDPGIGRYIESDPLGLFVVPFTSRSKRVRAFNLRLNHLYGYVDADPLTGLDPQGLSTISWGRLIAGAAGGGARGAGLGAIGILGGVGLGALASQCKPTPRDRCERGCDADYDFDQGECEAYWKMTGRDNSVLKVCMDKARKRYLDCYQDCAKEGD